MQKIMYAASWIVFALFVGLSCTANWMHGDGWAASSMLAVVPIGFAASVFIYEGLIAAGRSAFRQYWWQHLVFGALCGATGFASYMGLLGMEEDHGIDGIHKWAIPLAFDGVVAVSSIGIRAFAPTHIPVLTRPRVPRAVPSHPAVVSRDVPAVVSASVPQDKPVVSRRDKDSDLRDKAFRMLAEGRDKRDVAAAVGRDVRTLNRWVRSRDKDQVEGVR